MKQRFRRGQRKSVMIRNEKANPLYTVDFISALFEQESDGLFDVRQAILGHVQQGGDPSPFDRIQATRLAARCVTFLVEDAERAQASGTVIGLKNGHVQILDLDTIAEQADLAHMRPLEQWWLELRPIARLMNQLEAV